MNHDDIDRKLKNILENIPVMTPDENLAQRIVSYATAHPQATPLNPARLLGEYVSATASLWSINPGRQVAFLCVVALLAFANGLSYQNTQQDDDSEIIMSMVTGDLRGMGVL